MTEAALAERHKVLVEIEKREQWLSDGQRRFEENLRRLAEMQLAVRDEALRGNLKQLEQRASEAAYLMGEVVGQGSALTQIAGFMVELRHKLAGMVAAA